MKQPSLTQKTFELLKDRILHFQIRPGTVITVKELALALGISQTPIREALCILEHERLIERLPKKGCAVRCLNVQEVKELYDYRIAIEVFAAEEAAHCISKEDTDRLGDILKRLEFFISKTDKKQILELEQDVHVMILKATGNTFLIEAGVNILDRIWILQKIILYNSEHWQESNQQHTEIFKALEKGDSRKAATLMKQHLRWGKELVLSRLHDEDDFLSFVFSDVPDGYKFLREGFK